MEEQSRANRPYNDAMNRIVTGGVWLSFAVVVYLNAAEAVAPWVTLPLIGNIGFTLVFMVFSLLHCARCNGSMRTTLFFSASAIVSFLMEEIGVRTGLVYGPYHYGDLLGFKLGHVPAIIPLAWFMMIYPSWATARALMRGVDMRSAQGMAAVALVAAMVMTAWDTVMDPGMASAGNWIWERGGPYFGVPIRNYFGWLLTTFLVYVAAGLIWRWRIHISSVSRGFSALPLIVYAELALRYVLNATVPALHVVALFAMGLPGLLALIQTWLARDRDTQVVLP